MKKTYNINVGGTGFVIDDDAYDMLNDYLNTLDHIFARQEDGKELVDEMELRISEMLSEQLMLKNSTIVAKSDVEQIIARMGNPEEFVEYDETIRVEPEQPRNSEGTTPPPFDPTMQSGFLKKRLFRDPQDKMIGGVCSGIAQFLNVDVTWIRLICVILAFASFSTFALIYLVLWVVLPEANTPMQRMQMRGEKPTMENVSRSFSYGPGDINDNTVNSFADSLVRFFGIIGKILLVIFGILAWPVALACVIGIIGCIFSIIMFLTNSGYIWWNGLSTTALMANGAIPGLVCGIWGCLMVCIPCIFLISQFINSRNPEKQMGRGWKISLLILWIISIIGMAVTVGIGAANGFWGI